MIFTALCNAHRVLGCDDCNIPTIITTHPDEIVPGAWNPDTRARREGCDPVPLLEAVATAHVRFPSCRLVRNQVGNLTVVVAGEPVAWIDLTDGSFHDWPDDEDPR